MDPSFLQNFVNADHWLFERINGGMGNPVFDAVLPFITDLNHNRYLPYALLAIVLVWAVKQRYRAMMWMLTLVIAVGVSDLVSYRVVKSLAERNRPEQAGVHVVLRTDHHSGSSFPSNHAANAFAGATVLSGAFPVATPLWFLIAILIALSRVYVGVHFPLDVLAGALLGWTIGFSTKVLLGEWIGRAERSEENRFERGYKAEEKARRKDLMRRK
jgi:membrane-associated phospholipid phosphatase